MPDSDRKMPRSAGATARLRREPPGDRLSRAGLIVANLLVLLGLAGGAVIAQAVLSPKQSDYTYIHVAAAVIAVVTGLGSFFTMLLHWRAGARMVAAGEQAAGNPGEGVSAGEGRASATPIASFHTLRKNEMERLKKLRSSPVRRIGKIDAPQQLSLAEYFCLWMIVCLGGYGIAYQVGLLLFPAERIDEFSLLGSPFSIFLGVLAGLRLWSYHRASRRAALREAAQAEAKSSPPGTLPSFPVPASPVDTSEVWGENTVEAESAETSA